MELIIEYFSFLDQKITKNKMVLAKDLAFRQIDDTEGYIKGCLYFYAGFSLRIAKYVSIIDGNYKKIKYRYQLCDPDNIPLVRWDNAAHHSEILNFPFHKHDMDGTVISSTEISIMEIFNELYEIFDKIQNK